MSIAIVRRDKGGNNERWLLDMGDATVTLTSPDGRILLEWSPEDVANAVQLPSFSRNIKHTGFRVANRGLYQFSMDAASLKQLRAFANRGIAAGTGCCPINPSQSNSHLCRGARRVVCRRHLFVDYRL